MEISALLDAQKHTNASTYFDGGRFYVEIACLFIDDIFF